MFDSLSKDVFSVVCLYILPFIGLIAGYTIKRCQGFDRRYQRRQIENNGEALVRRSLKEYCRNNEAHVLSCVTLRLEDGSTTQIDHVLVSTKGIFVIETKHYNGWIFANRKAKFWKQIIYKNKYSFQNPLHQNYKHFKEIQRIFDFLESQFIHNIVVFSGESVFKTPKIDNVCYIEELIPKIEKYSDNALSLNRVQFCVGRLEYIRLELTQETDIEHQAYLEQKFGR